MGNRALRHPARLAGVSLLRLQSDERLAALAQDGHDAAFAAIVDRYRGPMLRYCAGLVGPDRAEDAVQQALINAHAALTKATDVQHLRSWMYRIAHNTSLNLLRSVRDEVPLDPSHAAAADGPHAAFEQTERLHATLTAVRDLPERQRAALLLREIEGRSHEEIATALGVTTGAARQHLMRARATVRAGVTAITPYPLVAKLAAAATVSPSAAAWGEAAAGAGVGVTLTKVTAGVMATGALVGGAVGSRQVVHHRRDKPTPVVRDAAAPARHAPANAAAALSVVNPAAAVSPQSHGSAGSHLRPVARKVTATTGDHGNGTTGERGASGTSGTSPGNATTPTGDGRHGSGSGDEKAQGGDDHSGSGGAGSGNHPGNDSGHSGDRGPGDGASGTTTTATGDPASEDTHHGTDASQGAVTTTGVTTPEPAATPEPADSSSGRSNTVPDAGKPAKIVEDGGSSGRGGPPPVEH
jgi:RNA polymerase sigma factor (sigma-70 family)